MPCSVSQGEIDWFSNQESRNILNKFNKPVDNHFESNRILCELCGKMTKSELIEKGVYEWYLKYLAEDAMNGSHPVSRLVSEILRIEKETL